MLKVGFYLLFYVPDHDRPSRPFEGAKKNTQVLFCTIINK